MSALIVKYEGQPLAIRIDPLDTPIPDEYEMDDTYSIHPTAEKAIEALFEDGYYTPEDILAVWGRQPFMPSREYMGIGVFVRRKLDGI